MKPRLAIFVSGSGTNMENIIREVQAGRLEAEVALVVCDKPDAPAVEKAKRSNVDVSLVDRAQIGSKEEFEQAIRAAVDRKKIDWLVLAGFMRVLSVDFVHRYWGKILNIHPSLLPKFPGAHAVRDAFRAGEKKTGVTTHFVIPAVDQGPIILQKKVAIEPGDTLETLEAKIHAVEYQIYPETLRLVLSGKVKPPIRCL